MNDTPKVYVVQCQHRRCQETGRLVPKYDLSSAEKFGELVYLLSPTASPFNSPPIVAELREKLRGYQDKDFLLLIGNPALILAVGALAACYNSGNVNVLQWSGKEGSYIAIRMRDLDPNI